MAMNGYSFYSTYEELKLVKVLYQVRNFRRFYSTYEELKHISSIFLNVS